MPGYANNFSKQPKRKRSRSRSGGFDSKQDDLNYVDEESDLSSVDEHLNTNDFGSHNVSSPRHSLASQQNETGAHTSHPRKRGRPKVNHSSASPAHVKEESTSSDKPSQQHAYGSPSASTATTTGTNGYESDKDEIGETKVDKFGRLQGGREYRVPTFTLPTRDDTLFMFSKDPAALLGFRDSFVFLKKNVKLQKVHIDNNEKGHLVDSNLLRSTFRTREISVVTARSVFKQFGHRIVKRGRKGRDDYYYTDEVDDGDDIPSEDEYYANNFFDSQSGINRPIPASSFIQPNHHYHHSSHHYNSSIALSAGGPNSLIGNSTNHDYGRNNLTHKLSLYDTQTNELNWLHNAALSTRQFNTSLFSYRKNNPTTYDLLTNVYQIPANKQTLKDTTAFNGKDVDPTSKTVTNDIDTNEDTIDNANILSSSADPQLQQNPRNATFTANATTSNNASMNMNPMTVAPDMRTVPNIQQ
ncbi:chromatin remodelling complex Rsc7/Swp82 subunit-domain-containing protein [Mycotypha africana]|uniref:chromatin remodelling complex Rsc7/Swp82 subunit-domain-containing protein n=1 Tax=Mycotypha africana TaxID=64632 RepID=UPI002300CB9A|nr:chromatin remodelling complex Rsc7/Swp82 subunit-domain-containing protein [Mycotypha africana]KAI8991625.1 chromatin remodelling complex Rsc7/Swp82 subunit-domain-containing protein [Mycotypha africana]